MRCMSCGANIPPEWVNAIQQNTCPGCGGEIMNSETQELLQELSAAMERMPNDPQGVAGWLLSNYQFRKIGSAEPVEKFHRKGGVQAGQLDESNLKVDDSYSEFVKRNEAEQLIARSNELAKIKQNSSGPIAELASMIEAVKDPYGDDPAEETNETLPADLEEQKAYLEMKASGFDPFAAAPVGGITDMAQVIDPNDVVNLMSQNQDAPLKEELELAQTAKGRAVLEKDKFKKLKAQEAVAGGGGGSFRR